MKIKWKLACIYFSFRVNFVYVLKAQGTDVLIHQRKNSNNKPHQYPDFCLWLRSIFPQTNWRLQPRVWRISCRRLCIPAKRIFKSFSSAVHTYKTRELFRGNFYKILYDGILRGNVKLFQFSVSFGSVSYSSK